MTAASLVDEARVWAKDLVDAETRGWGDQPDAMRRLANRLGVPWRTLWNLLYRPPKTIGAEIYLPLKAAAQQHDEATGDIEPRSAALAEGIARVEAQLADLRAALGREHAAARR